LQPVLNYRTSAKQYMFSSLFFCLAVNNFAQKLPNEFSLHEIFREGWQWASECMIKFWWRSGSPFGYRDCFLDSSLLGDTEIG